MGRCCSKYSEEIGEGVHLHGKLAIVTGPTSGIGFITAKEKKLQSTAALINESVQHEPSPGAGRITSIQCDLSSLSSVQRFVNEFLALDLPLHYLVNNAGVMGLPYGVSEDGYDVQMATNHLSHFFLTELLLPKLKQSAPSRIVNVSSELHKLANIKIDSIDECFRPSPKSFKSVVAYWNSKLCNVLHARSLAHRLRDTGVTAYSLHPGVVATDIGANVCASFYTIFGCCMKTASQGAATSMTCLLDDVGDLSGAYFKDCEVAKTSSKGSDDALAEALWQYSDEAIRKYERSKEQEKSKE